MRSQAASRSGSVARGACEIVAATTLLSLLGCAAGPAPSAKNGEGMARAGATERSGTANAAPPESQSRAAFAALVALVTEISEEWIGPARGIESAEEDALAHESLAAVLSGALEFYLTEDFDKPQLTPIVSPRRKWSDNPDARYYFAPLRGDGAYRIKGRRGSEVYLSFSLHRGDRDGGWPQGVAADLNMNDMRFEQDGRYEVVLSPEKRPGNWMALPPDAGSIIVRFYYQNEKPAAADPTTVPEISIEREHVAGAPPTPAVDDATVAARLERVANWVRSKYGRQILPPKGGPMPAWFASTPNTLGPPQAWESEKSGGRLGARGRRLFGGTVRARAGRGARHGGSAPARRLLERRPLERDRADGGLSGSHGLVEREAARPRRRPPLPDRRRPREPRCSQLARHGGPP